MWRPKGSQCCCPKFSAGATASLLCHSAQTICLDLPKFLDTGGLHPMLRPRNSLQAESWDSYGTHLLCFPFRCSLPYATYWLMSKNCCFIYSVLFCNSFMRRYKPGSFCSILAGNKSLPSEHMYLIVMVSIWKAHFRHWLFHIKWFCYIDFT